MNKTKWIIFVIVILLLIGMLYFFFPKRVAVLGYHSFYKTEIESKGENTANIKDFEKQMEYLYDKKYKTLSLDEFYSFMEGKKSFPRKSVLLTFDDGYLSNYMYVIDILKKYDFKATIFIIGKNVINSDGEGTNNSYMSLEQITEIKENNPNIEFASHTYNLHDLDLSYKTKEIIEEDIKQMSRIIKSDYIAYPYGLHNDMMKKVYKDKGYKLAFGFGPNRKDFRKAKISDDDYNIPRLCIDSNMSLFKFKLRLLLPY